MIRKIQINLSAEHPEIPLIEGATFVGSPSAVFVSGVPQAVGSWRITSVKVVATYPDDSAPTVECVKGADGVYVATIPATATSGRVTNGLQIIADGIDERGEPVTGYVLGMADFAVYLRDMTIEGAAGVKYYLHLLNAEPTDPKEGDAYLDGSTLAIYHDGEWTEIAGGGYEPPPGGIPKTDLSAGVQASLDKADTALQNTGDQTLNGALTAKSFTFPLFSHGTETVFGSVSFDGSKGVPIFSIIVGGIAIAELDMPITSGTLALLSNIYAAVQQIAPDFTAKVYAANELCSYNGVVYRCKSAYTATASSTKPNSDTTHWEVKKVSELFLPITGGTMEGAIRFRDGNFKEEYDSYRKWYLASLLGVLKLTSTDNNTILFPVASGTLALLSDTMRFSTAVSYAVGDVVFYNGAFYRCTTAHTAGAWNASHFAEVLGLSTVANNVVYPTAPTPTAGDDSTKVATTAFVKTAVAGATPNLDYVMRVDPETGGIYYTTPDTNA